MKTPAFLPLPSFLALTLLASPLALAQEPVSTGKVVDVSTKTGTLVLHSAQTNQPITFYGMDKARVLTASGRAVTLKEIQPTMDVAVHYTVGANDRWVVGRVVIPEATVPAVAASTPALTSAESRAITSEAANDGDITTQPATKARIDNDRTTQPGSKALIDNDRTTQPGSKALIDNDRTTQPGSKALIDNDRTTQPGKTQPGDPDITKRPDNR